MKIFTYLTCVLVTAMACAQSYTINGYVKDAENGEALIGATIYDQVSKKGTITNTYGFFSLTLPSDSVNLVVTFVGYPPQTFRFLNEKNVTLDVNLNPGDMLEEVVVTAEESIEQTPQMSTIDIGVEKIKAIPSLLGEADVLKSIQLLPGIQSGTEGSSGIYVRGGGPDQNLILLDGVPVYNASHLFGFFSVFNPDAINRVTVTKGGFPARYGGRLSSVIDISMKEGNNQKIQGQGSIGLISSKFTIEGPIKNEKTSFIVSGRRTYIDFLTRPIIQAASQGDAIFGYYFYDLNTKINHRFSDRDRLYLSFYGGQDKAYARNKYDYFQDDLEYENEDEFGLDWGNIITAIRWNHLFTPKLFGNLTATYSKYQFGIFEKFESSIKGVGVNERSKEQIEYYSGIHDYAVKLDFDYLPVPSHTIKVGVSTIRHEFNPGVLAFDSSFENDTTIGVTESVSIESSAYVEDDFSIGNMLRFNFGLHGSVFWAENEQYQSLQPRLAGRLLLPGLFSIKASYSEMVQFIHLLTNGGIGLPTDLWVPATDRIRPQSSKQIAFGLAKNIGVYEVSVESYYKTMSNLIEYRDGSSYFNSTDNWEEKVVSGDGTSYGVELFIQKKTGRFNGWLGYTWSKTTRQFEELNFGEPYPYKFDRRHDVSIVGIYQTGSLSNVSATWVYGTGNAISMPTSKYNPIDEYPAPGRIYVGNEVEFYETRNNYRMRSYHRLDISYSKSKEKKRGTRTWTFGAYNVYNRKNPFFVDLSYDNQGNKKFIQYSLFPIIPFVKWDFKF